MSEKRTGQDATSKEENRKAPRRIAVFSEQKYLDKVLPVRLPAEKLEKIKQEARELVSFQFG